jgi:hypothetical protein
MANPTAIYLQPECFSLSDEGRMWSERPDGPCEDCGAPWVKYVLAHDSRLEQDDGGE